MPEHAETFGGLPYLRAHAHCPSLPLTRSVDDLRTSFSCKVELRSLSVDDSVVIFFLSVQLLRKGRLPLDACMARASREGS